jgi:hypothetical protein
MDRIARKKVLSRYFGMLPDLTPVAVVLLVVLADLTLMAWWECQPTR